MSYTILIVDDNSVIRRLLRLSIEQETGWEVCGEAVDGRDAVQKAQELQPDLIVMDLSMPVMSGLEAARILRRLMPTVPLVIFSEYVEVLSEDEARSMGISARVSKSEPLSALVSKARALLSGIAA